MIHTSPSNLALIKYMGKKDKAKNIPLNSSLSYTLNHFVSGVELTLSDQDAWAPLEGTRWEPISMRITEQIRFLNFFKKLKTHMGLEGHYLIRSANNFPKSTGLASSASSFSALTLATYQEALKNSLDKEKILSLSKTDLAFLSQEGSGSSCRSFFSPWCLWEEGLIQALELPYTDLNHDLIYLDKGEKKIQSSLAHERVRTSPHFSGRVSRAQMRLQQLLQALKKKDWPQIYLIVKEEFEDMHRLFETAQPSFSYRTPKTYEAIEEIEKIWKDKKDGPLMTMDAGNQIHLLYRLEQESLRSSLKERLCKIKGVTF